MSDSVATTKARMPKELKAKWLEALRSGKYKQQKNKCLFDGEAYCCLGVLQVVADGQVERLDAKYPSIEWSLAHECVQSYVEGIPCTSPAFDPQVPDTNGYPVPVSYLNDYGTPFSEIAAAIEEHVEGV